MKRVSESLCQRKESGRRSHVRTFVSALWKVKTVDTLAFDSSVDICRMAIPNGELISLLGSSLTTKAAFVPSGENAGLYCDPG